MTSGREYSDETARMMDEEISRILFEQEQRAHDLLIQHRTGLDMVAEALLEKETIDGQEVAQLVQAALGDGAPHPSESTSDSSSESTSDSSDSSSESSSVT